MSSNNDPLDESFENIAFLLDTRAAQNDRVVEDWEELSDTVEDYIDTAEDVARERDEYRQILEDLDHELNLYFQGDIDNSSELIRRLHTQIDDINQSMDDLEPRSPSRLRGGFPWGYGFSTLISDAVVYAHDKIRGDEPGYPDPEGGRKVTDPRMTRRDFIEGGLKEGAVLLGGGILYNETRKSGKSAPEQPQSELPNKYTARDRELKNIADSNERFETMLENIYDDPGKETTFLADNETYRADTGEEVHSIPEELYKEVHNSLEGDN